uniref:Uncharacterized protein n=1 Tax=Arsenophonus endosymbiont of Trialeurodes vaporariorum TaxID=235567 RepID=A0A3B0LZG4_9GAMM
MHYQKKMLATYIRYWFFELLLDCAIFIGLKISHLAKTLFTIKVKNSKIALLFLINSF